MGGRGAALTGGPPQAPQPPEPDNHHNHHPRRAAQVVQSEPVKYPEDVPISDHLKDLLHRMLIKVGGWGAGQATASAR